MDVEGTQELPGQWAHVNKLLTRTGPLAPAMFDPSDPNFSILKTHCRVLVVGAGGLGCEILKDLALLGFGHLDVIDMDTIDLSNLNRQFLFRQSDVGKDKATVAANFVNARVPGCRVTPHFCPIESKDADFYRGFNIVVCGLDSIVARRWLNGMLMSLLQYENGELMQSSIIPLIDGGTEGFKGNARVILPGMTPCIECTLDLYPPQINYPMCTIAHTPRLPEHCIEYAKVILWPKEREDQTIDGDDPEHIKWLFEKACERAAEYGIAGVTYRLTQGVVKRIIPAVASTNAVIAAVCANEAFKLATTCCTNINNYMVFNDGEGIYSFTFEYERKADCLACSSVPIKVPVSATTTLEMLIKRLQERPDMQLKQPGVTAELNGRQKSLYMQRPAALEQATRPNLTKTLAELGLVQGQEVNVTDPTSPKPIRLVLLFE
eukprot:m.95535 g.95535  ORF g.95535 m.95535 type:complete len:435 (-) comp15455_c0_seq1:321-1625(-)